MSVNFRKGLKVVPKERINQEQIQLIHNASLSILNDPGIICFNEHAADILDKAGCKVKSEEDQKGCWRIRFPGSVVAKALESVPGQVILGARDRNKRLFLDAEQPETYFGTGSETNIFLRTELEDFVQKGNPSVTRKIPVYKKERGNIKYLCGSAKLCNKLSNVDFFIRNVNIQDSEITPENKDVNIFFASLKFMTKHVQAGLVNLEKLQDVISLAEIVAGGKKEFKENPVISFITCLIKSPLQMVEDTTEKLIHISKTGIPVVISSSPQGGSTAPIQEEGMVALINAEILAGITLAQIVNPGTPVLYGAVPVRARLDTLHDLYGAPEFIHYNTDCIQMARHYGIPCYSTAGVGDAKVPGLQATLEKVFSHLEIAQAGAQYIHYAIGLLEKTNRFSPLQAVLDDAQIGIVKEILRKPKFGKEETESAVAQVRKVMKSSTRLFARHIRKAVREGLVSNPYPFETGEEEDRVLINAYHKLKSILDDEDERLESEVIEKIYDQITGLLPDTRFEPKDNE
ncbi:MAG: trimethylamine methyltransferase family protein [bacterium]